MPARRHNTILLQRLKRNDFHMKHRIGNVDKNISEESSAFCCFGKSLSSSLSSEKKKKTPTTVLAQRRRQQFCESRGEEPIIAKSPTNETVLEEFSSSDLSATSTEDTDTTTPIKRVRFASEVEIRRIGNVRVDRDDESTKSPPTKPSRSKRNLKQSIVNRSEFDKKVQRDKNDKAKNNNNNNKSSNNTSPQQ
mmetsp:Transcript_15610/g.39273  ORF Transcript_15610/g.39273 Transcript_15610/m.39273 type:complete len:193 (+) Transcript_15610:158-736(+)